MNYSKEVASKAVAIAIIIFWLSGCSTPRELKTYVVGNTEWYADKHMKNLSDEEIIESIQKNENHYGMPYDARKIRVRIKDKLVAELFSRHPEWSEDKKREMLNIFNNKVTLGMTKDQVMLSWGQPDDINRTVGSWGVNEQWVYKKSRDMSNWKYLYLKNGRLTSWQD